MSAASARLHPRDRTIISSKSARDGSLATALPMGALREPSRNIESRGDSCTMAAVMISATGSLLFSVVVSATEVWRFRPLDFCFFGAGILTVPLLCRAFLAISIACSIVTGAVPQHVLGWAVR